MRSYYEVVVSSLPPLGSYWQCLFGQTRKQFTHKSNYIFS